MYLEIAKFGGRGVCIFGYDSYCITVDQTCYMSTFLYK